MKKLTLAGAILAAATLACASGARANELPSGNYTFTFSGQCSDCTGYGTATLSVQNYTLNSALANSNLVDFSYTSDLTTLDISPDNDFLSLDTLSGSIDTAPGSYDVHVASLFLGFIPIGFFDSYKDGTWSVSNPVPADYGTGGTWNASAVSAAPEPSTWLLMFAGIGGVGLMLRRAKKTMNFRSKDAFSA